jgi:RNA recognition motif-containing protein
MSNENHWSDDEIEQLFKGNHATTVIRSIKHKKHYCFVEFETEQQALDALELNGTSYKGKEVRLNWATNSQNEYSIFVGDLPKHFYDEQLHALFQEYASIKNARVLYDTNGVSRGYGFVRFGSQEDQQKAIQEKNGLQWKGSDRIIRVSIATPRRRNLESPIPNNTTVFVGGLNSNVTEGDLVQY